jgi:hypothetical protein
MIMTKPKDDDWVTTRVNGARKALPVSDAVATAIKDQLNGTMRERALRPGELAEVAATLLAAVNNPPVKEPMK